MKTILAALAVLSVCGCAPEGAAPARVETAPPELAPPTLPSADGAGNRMEALEAVGGRWCGAGWCVASQADGIVADHAGRSVSITWPAEENQSSAPWPYVITSGEAALVGAVVTETAMYSGGGARVDRLVLYEVSEGAAREVLRLPHAGQVSIRACFDEADVRARAEACLDEYAFVSRVRLDESVSAGAPRIVLETAAASYPGRVSRSVDSTTRAPLADTDLVWATDDVCSYRRTFTRGATGAYMPDTELPACADYLEP